MAYIINKIKTDSPSDIANAIETFLRESRFCADIITHRTKVAIHKIRLLKSKDYCGNHPNACPVRPGGHRPHVHSTCLEGTDWVAFNDMVNDALDALMIEANVASSLCIVRKGKLRRNEYHGHLLGNNIDREWDRDTTFDNYVDNVGGNPMQSIYPKDTPGIQGWRLLT